MDTIFVRDFFEALELFFDGSFDSGINRIRSEYVFRGMCKSNYLLEPSIRRNCGDKIGLEQSILRNFSKYAMMEKPEMADSVWKQLIIGQHHGLPTRLLDWSYSPLAALHFATDDKDLDKLEDSDAVVWKVSLSEINSLMPPKYQEILGRYNSNILTVDMLKDAVEKLEEYDQDMGTEAFAFLEPPSIDSRIINQYALFSIVPNALPSLDNMIASRTKKSKKYIISKDAKWQIRDMLDQMNLNERVFYPGLDGLAAWLKRHYYAKRMFGEQNDPQAD